VKVYRKPDGDAASVAEMEARLLAIGNRLNLLRHSINLNEVRVCVRAVVLCPREQTQASGPQASPRRAPLTAAAALLPARADGRSRSRTWCRTSCT
jgi:hypothetical protein